LQLNIRKNPAEEAERERLRIDSDFKSHIKIMPTFCKTAKAFMARAGWNYMLFENKTGIDRKTYYQIQREELEYPEFETVLKICVGLRLNKEERNELLRLTGNDKRTARKHFIYLYILDEYDIKSPSDFNDVYLRLYPREPPPFKNDGR